MPLTKVDINKLQECENVLSKANGSITNIQTSFVSTGRSLDWDIKSSADINRRINQISQNLESEIRCIKKMVDFFALAQKRYEEADRSEKKVNDIFSGVDNSYLNKIVLKKDDIDGIQDLVACPGCVIHDVVPGYLDSVLAVAEKLKENSGILNVPMPDQEFTKKVFDVVSEALGKLGKWTKDEDLGLAGKVVKYVNSFRGFVHGEYANGWEAVAGWLPFLKTSADTETGLYDYFLNTLKPEDGEAIYNRFGKGMGYIGIIGAISGFTGKVVDMVESIKSGETKNYENLSKFIETIGSGIDAIGKAYITQNFSSKIIEIGEKGKKLVTKDSKALGRVAAKFAIVDVAIGSVSSTVKEAGRLIEEGSDDVLNNIGRLGIAFSTGGLVKIFNKIPLVNIDSDAAVDYMEHGAINVTNDWLKEHPDWQNYITSRKGPVVFKVAASSVAAVVANVEDVGEKVSHVAGTAKDVVAGWFSKVKKRFG